MLVFKHGNLFEATCSLGHCVSQDFKMSKGIADQFRQRFGRIPELLGQKACVGEVAVLRSSQGFLYYLVTKRRFYQKPSTHSVRSSLQAMKRHMIRNGVQTVALPRIACGLDQVPWSEIKEILQDLFDTAPVSVIVYLWDN